MSEMINIGGIDLAPIEYRGARVMTLSMMDSVHKRPDGTAGRNFRENRERLVEGEDFFEINQPDEIRRLGVSRPQGGTPAMLLVLTQTGYSMLVKSFTDDLAWDVQRQLVKSYFGGERGGVLVARSSSFDDAMRALQLAPLAMNAAEAFGLDKNAAAISANQYICALTGQNLLKGFGQTHLLAANQDTQWFTPTQLSADAGISAQKLNAALSDAGFQQRRGKEWELLPPGKPYARLFDTGKKHEKGAPVQQIRWSPAVLDALRQRADAPGQDGLLGGV